MKGIRGRNYPATVAALLQIQRKLIQNKTVMQNKSKLHIIYLYLNTNIRYISYTNRITFQKTSKMYSPNGQRNMNDMIWLWLCLKIILKAQTMLVKFRTACGHEPFPNWPLQLVLEGRHPGRQPQVKPVESQSQYCGVNLGRKKAQHLRN